MEPNIGTEGYTALGGRTEENRRLAAENARLREALTATELTSKQYAVAADADCRALAQRIYDIARAALGVQHGR